MWKTLEIHTLPIYANLTKQSSLISLNQDMGKKVALEDRSKIFVISRRAVNKLVAAVLTRIAIAISTRDALAVWEGALCVVPLMTNLWFSRLWCVSRPSLCGSLGGSTILLWVVGRSKGILTIGFTLSVTKNHVPQVSIPLRPWYNEPGSCNLMIIDSPSFTLIFQMSLKDKVLVS